MSDPRNPSALVFAVLVLGALMAPMTRAQDLDRRLTLRDSLGFGIYRPVMRSVEWSEDGTAYRVGSQWHEINTGKPVAAPERKRPADREPDRPVMKPGEIGARVSPDGKRVAFVRDHDLFVRPLEGEGAEIAISNDGSPELLYGRLDWVYQEEVYGRGNFNGMWWSPDGAHLAFLRIDEAPVQEFTVVDHVPTTLALEVTNYPKAGYPNPIATLGVWCAATGEIAWVDMSAYEGMEPLIVRVGWTPKGDRVMVQIQDRIQTLLDLVSADPDTGAVQPLFRERGACWVNVLGEPEWIGDDRFLWLSERTGYQHLYLYEADGTLVNAVTEGPWEVRSVIKVDAKRGEVFFYGARESAIAQHAYRVGLDGKGLVHLTPDRGSHDVAISEDGLHVLDRWTSLENPGRAVLRDRDGNVVRELDEARFTPEYFYRWPESVTIPARDGFEMDATVLKPHDFDPAKSYPVLLMTYSGPNAASVGDVFRADPWPQFLAQEGIIVLQVNNRSSSGRGQQYTQACYKDFGASELADLEDAVTWLCKNPWADGERVGITGWSYGGFMTAYALCRSKLFTLGIAGAGVYDWRLYDTIYTERYMSTPQLNPEGYRNASPMSFAKDLHGHLVLVHGTMDDNVHLQNTLQFAFELQKAGKQFEMMLYPKCRHGLGEVPQARVHFRELQWNVIRRHLLGAKD